MPNPWTRPKDTPLMIHAHSTLNTFQLSHFFRPPTRWLLTFTAMISMFLCLLPFSHPHSHWAKNRNSTWMAWVIHIVLCASPSVIVFILFVEFFLTGNSGTKQRRGKTSAIKCASGNISHSSFPSSSFSEKFRRLSRHLCFVRWSPLFLISNVGTPHIFICRQYRSESQTILYTFYEED